MIVYSAKMDNYVYCQTGNMLVNEAFSCGISLEEMADYSHEIRQRNELQQHSNSGQQCSADARAELELESDSAFQGMQLQVSRVFLLFLIQFSVTGKLGKTNEIYPKQ